MQRNASSSRAKPTNYPALSLRLCLDKALAMIDAMPDAEVFLPVEEFAALAGYEGFNTNSAPKGFVAALRHFGLLEKQPTTRNLRLAAAVRAAAGAGRERLARLVAESVARPACYQAMFRRFAVLPGRAAVEQALTADGMGARQARLIAGAFLQDWALAESLGVKPGALLPEAANDAAEPTGGACESILLPAGTSLRLVFSGIPTAEQWKFLRDYAALKAA